MRYLYFLAILLCFFTGCANQAQKDKEDICINLIQEDNKLLKDKIEEDYFIIDRENETHPNRAGKWFNISKRIKSFSDSLLFQIKELGVQTLNEPTRKYYSNIRNLFSDSVWVSGNDNSVHHQHIPLVVIDSISFARITSNPNNKNNSAILENYILLNEYETLAFCLSHRAGGEAVIHNDKIIPIIDDSSRLVKVGTDYSTQIKLVHIDGALMMHPKFIVKSLEINGKPATSQFRTVYKGGEYYVRMKTSTPGIYTFSGELEAFIYDVDGPYYKTINPVKGQFVVAK